MNNDKPKTHWVQPGEMPQPGTKCPVCNEGYLKKSQYGIWCEVCLTNYKVSKFPPVSGFKSRAEIPKVIPTSEGEIVKGLRNIWIELHSIKELLEKKSKE